jgi:hypothetical protein
VANVQQSDKKEEQQRQMVRQHNMHVSISAEYYLFYILILKSINVGIFVFILFNTSWIVEICLCGLTSKNTFFLFYVASTDVFGGRNY